MHSFPNALISFTYTEHPPWTLNKIHSRLPLYYISFNQTTSIYPTTHPTDTKKQRHRLQTPPPPPKIKWVEERIEYTHHAQFSLRLAFINCLNRSFIIPDAIIIVVIVNCLKLQHVTHSDPQSVTRTSTTTITLPGELAQQRNGLRLSGLTTKPQATLVPRLFSTGLALTQITLPLTTNTTII